MFILPAKTLAAGPECKTCASPKLPFGAVPSLPQNAGDFSASGEASESGFARNTDEKPAFTPGKRLPSLKPKTQELHRPTSHLQEEAPEARETFGDHDRVEVAKLRKKRQLPASSDPHSFSNAH